MPEPLWDRVRRARATLTRTEQAELDQMLTQPCCHCGRVWPDVCDNPCGRELAQVLDDHERATVRDGKAAG